jgi:hypothetical protein
VSALQTVHVRVNDAATGQPTPVRIQFIGPPDVTYYAPFGRLAEFATGRGEDVGGNLQKGADGKPYHRYAYIDGTCEIRLPTGRITVAAVKGLEHEILFEEVFLTPGKMALRFEIKRALDSRAERWYSGDTQAFFLSPHAALLEGAAEDLAVVNLLACCASHGAAPPALSNVLAFSGQRPALEMPGHMVVVNTLNEHPVLGRLALLNCHRVVYPLAFGGPGELDNWTLADWCDQCHRKGGLVVAADFFTAERWQRGEIIADLLLRKIDALDICPPSARPMLNVGLLDYWYHLLNCGFRVPLVGGSGKDSNNRTLGGPRTYARLALGEEFTYQSWIAAVRAGRTFVTSNPCLLFFTVDGNDPGCVLDLTEQPKTVRIRAELRGGLPGKLEVVLNGRVVADATVREGDDGKWSSLVEADLPLARGGWLAARHVYADSENLLCAHTSPVYVMIHGKAPQPDPAALAFVGNHLDTMLAWVDREGRFENDKQKQRLAGIFQKAREALPERLAERSL